MKENEEKKFSNSSDFLPNYKKEPNSKLCRIGKVTIVVCFIGNFSHHEFPNTNDIEFERIHKIHQR